MLEFQHVVKRYEDQIVLDRLSLSLLPGQIFCLLGKNGVGKTTLISCLLDLVEMEEGSIEVFGKSHQQLQKEDKRRLGCVLDDLGLIEEMNAFDYLLWVGKIYGIPSNLIAKRTEDLFQFFFEDFAPLYNTIGQFSTGMKKKVAFCAAVLHTPDLLILDEPFSGLDPLVANQMIQFLKKYQREDRLIFISSHDLSYVEKVATHIGVLHEANMVYHDTIENFTQQGEQKLDAALLTILKPNTANLSAIDWV
ncbi:MAG: ABC transporter ATP-binding protein [Spirosomataceae bacterium]